MSILVKSRFKLDSDLKKELLERTYLKYNIVNINEVYDCEKELVESNIYLPNLLRQFISNDYYIHVTDSEVYDKLNETRSFTRQESVEEFVKWIEDNRDYNQLLDEPNLNMLYQELERFKKV